MSDIIGFIGVIITVIAYLLLQISFLKIEDIPYSLLNALGSLMILYSLYFHWNLSCAVIETFWCAISLYGVIKATIKKNRLKLKN